MMSSASSSYTGKRDRPDASDGVQRSPPPVSSTHSMTISVRWIITSSAVVLLNSKMFSIISFSPASMAPRLLAHDPPSCGSPPPMTSSSSALGSMCSRRSTPLVDLDSSQITGRMTTATAATTPAGRPGPPASVFFMAMRLGTSSPSTRREVGQHDGDERSPTMVFSVAGRDGGKAHILGEPVGPAGRKSCRRRRRRTGNRPV